jgi:hypothetical protein
MAEIFDMQRIDLGKDSSGRPLIINRRTKRMLDIVDEKIGRSLVIVKGSFFADQPPDPDNPSAKTHDGSGVMDIRTHDQTSSQVKETVLELRKIGFAAWHRTKANSGFDDHIHAVAIGDPQLHPQAANQVTAYKNRRNGLSGTREGPDDGPLLEPLPPVFPILEVEPTEPTRRVPEMILVRQPMGDEPDRIWLLSATNRRHVTRNTAFQTLLALGIPFNPDETIRSGLLQSFPEGDPITDV